MRYGITKKIAAAVITFAVIAVFISCSKDDPKDNNTTPGAVIPTVSITNAAGGITSTSATSGGTIVTDGGAALSASGLVWSKNTIQPTLAVDSSNNVGTVVGSFVANMNNLTPGTMYYVRAYATNSAGTAYGPRINFTTLP